MPRMPESDHSKQVLADAQGLVHDVGAFTNVHREAAQGEAAQQKASQLAFAQVAKDWQSITSKGPSYANEVAERAAAISNSPTDRYVPKGTVLGFSNDPESISFESSSAEKENDGGHARQIRLGANGNIEGHDDNPATPVWPAETVDCPNPYSLYCPGNKLT
jgi:hypothetical protein